jgi:hypothetical protein
MTIRPVAAELFHANERADKRDESNVAFPNFANAPEINIPISSHVRPLQPESHVTGHPTYYVFLIIVNDLKNIPTSPNIHL